MSDATGMRRSTYRLPDRATTPDGAGSYSLGPVASSSVLLSALDGNQPGMEP